MSYILYGANLCAMCTDANTTTINTTWFPPHDQQPGQIDPAKSFEPRPATTSHARCRRHVCHDGLVLAETTLSLLLLPVAAVPSPVRCS